MFGRDAAQGPAASAGVSTAASREWLTKPARPRVAPNPADYAAERAS